MDLLPLVKTLRLMDARPGKTPEGDPPYRAWRPHQKWHLLAGCGRGRERLSEERFRASLRFSPRTTCGVCAKIMNAQHTLWERVSHSTCRRCWRGLFLKAYTDGRWEVRSNTNVVKSDGRSRGKTMKDAQACATRVARMMCDIKRQEK